MNAILLRKYCAWASALMMVSVLCAEAQNTTTRVSIATGGAQGTSASQWASVSADGRFVAFQSSAPNLVAGDTNGVTDMFVHDRQTGVTERVNISSGGAQADSAVLQASAGSPSISGDGRFVAFQSIATNLVSGDTNAVSDVFVRDRQAGTTTRVSVATGGAQATGGSGNPVISADGRFVVFDSVATDLVSGDTNGTSDIFLHDRQTGTTTRVNVSTGGAQATGGGGTINPRISPNGRYVGLSTAATGLVPGNPIGLNDVYVRDVQAGTTTRVSVGPNGVQTSGFSSIGNFTSDGRHVVFDSTASGLTSGGGVGVFIHDLQTGVTSALAVVPTSTPSNQRPRQGRISGNGRFLVYQNMGGNQIFLFDRQTSTTTQVDVSTAGVQGANSTVPAINADGTVVTFNTFNSNLVSGDTNGVDDVFVRHLPGNAGPTLPTMALDKTSLRFGAVTSGAAFLSQTAPQTVRLTQAGAGSVTWTATSNQTWLQVSPASGSGPANLSISVAAAVGLPASGSLTGAITLVLTGASNTAGPIAVTLTLLASGTAASPFGFVDTPLDNTTGVTGAVPFTGWTLDDVGVERVMVCRAAVAGEVAPVDPNCGGAAQIFVGFAVFIDGARTDVAALHPTVPQSTRAGWGFMVLTNMLPNQGNGTYQFFMYSQDRDGHTTLLGTRTLTCANASATKPFGAIDTPTQGGPASGANFINFGWALTPQPKIIPINGSTMTVMVDGAPLGPVDYNHERPDIEALFPGFQNTAGANGAVGFRAIDTTTLTNGLHTISWTVTDSLGVTEGIGSRFFTVANGAGAVTAAENGATSAAAARARTTLAGPEDIASAPQDDAPVLARRGWDLEAPWRWYGVGGAGRTVIRGEEVDRFELWLGAQSGAHYTGHLRVGDALAQLPVGSQLDAATGQFTWAPGVGFVGRYDLVFVRWMGTRAVARHEVRVILAPKGSGHVGVQVAIDTPRSQQDVGQPFMLAGWAADLDAATGTGIDTLHVWAYPATGGAPVFLGTPAFRGARPDVAAVHGDQFRDVGFALIVQGLAPGTYDLAVFPWSNVTGAFAPARTVRVILRP